MSAPPHSVVKLAALVEQIIAGWRSGSTPDARRAIAEHPELLGCGSLLVDLVYEEYCLREMAGDAPDPDELCRRFPAFQTYIREVLQGHRDLVANPEPPAVWPNPGDPIDTVVVVCELGRGAFGRAYLARDPEAGDRPVVVKMTPGRSVEAKTLGPIRHEHIVGVLWARQVGRMSAVCMPFLGAATLHDSVAAAFAPKAPPRSGRSLLRSTDPNLSAATAPIVTGVETYAEAAVAVCARLAGAVAHLHAIGITHSDIKPANVLLGPGGHPYLIDFNLSHGSDAELRGGTLPYMAPERLAAMLGGTAPVGTGTAEDVYAFGVLLHEVLTGRVPYEPTDGPPGRGAIEELLSRIRAAGPSHRHPAIPRRLGRLIDRCLGPAGLRPNMVEVKGILDRFLARGVWGRALGIGFVGVAVTAWGLFSLANRPAPPPPSSGDVSSVLPDTPFARGLHYLKAGDAPAAEREFARLYQTSPDGRTAAYRGFCQARSGNHRGAAGLFRTATRTHNYTAAWVHANLAYCLAASAPTPASLREGDAEADKAVRMDPTLTAARLNRAYVQFLLAVSDESFSRSTPTPLADIEEVMRNPPDSAKAYYVASAVVAVFGGSTSEADARAVGYLAEAVRRGWPTATLAQSPAFRGRVAARDDFKAALMVTPAPPARPAPDPHLAVPPLD